MKKSFSDRFCPRFSTKLKKVRCLKDKCVAYGLMWKMVVPSTGLSDYVPNGERCKHYNLTHENWIMYRCGDKIRNGAWYIIEAYKKGLICKPLDYDLLTKEAEYGEWGESPELKKYRDEKREIMMVKDRGLFSMLKYRIKKRFMNKEN